MVNILASRRLAMILILGNFILIAAFIGFNLRKTFTEQSMNQLVSKRFQLRENIRLWEKFGDRLIVSSSPRQESLSKEIRKVIKKYGLNSAIFTETKNGFDLKLGAQTDWDIYMAIDALQKQLKGRYILLYFQISRSSDSATMSAILQWVQ